MDTQADQAVLLEELESTTQTKANVDQAGYPD
jgi:hypothetical protein